MSEGKFPVAILKWVLVTVPFSLLCGVARIAALLSGEKAYATPSFVLAAGCVFRVASSDHLAVKKGKLRVIERVCTIIKPAPS